MKLSTRRSSPGATSVVIPSAATSHAPASRSLLSTRVPRGPIRAVDVTTLQRTVGNRAVARLLQQQTQQATAPELIQRAPQFPVQIISGGQPSIQRAYSDQFDEDIMEKINDTNEFSAEYDSTLGGLRSKFTPTQITALVSAVKTLIDNNQNFTQNIIKSIDVAMGTLDASAPITPGSFANALRANSTLFNLLKGPGVLPPEIKEEIEEEVGESVSSLIGKLSLPEEKAKLLEAHVTAYHQSRYYHMTRPVNVKSIQETGLDPRYGGSDRGLSHAHPNSETSAEYKERSKGYVHLGKDYFSIQAMEETLKGKYPKEVPQYLRIFLDAKQKSRLAVDQDVDKGSIDGKTASAAKTQIPIQPHQIALGPFKNLEKTQQLKICDFIKQFYPSPSVSTEEVLQIHIFALEHQLIFTDDPGNKFRADEKDKRPRRYSF